MMELGDHISTERFYYNKLAFALLARSIILEYFNTEII